MCLSFLTQKKANYRWKCLETEAFKGDDCKKIVDDSGNVTIETFRTESFPDSGLLTQQIQCTVVQPVCCHDW